MNASTKQNEGLGKYMPLAFAAGIGSMLGSGIIVGLSSTITVWQITPEILRKLVEGLR